MSNKISIYSLSLIDLEKQLIKLNLKKHNAAQIFQWIYQKQTYAFNKMTNIAKTSYQILDNNFQFNHLKLVQKNADEKEETIKFLFELHDKELIETVLMKFDYGYSICISSQIGCNMGCKFCASGLLKKIRNLSTDELVLQLVEVQKYLQDKNNVRISNIVVMGIGEPFDNYDNLKQAINIFNNHYGIAIGSRHITVSTCGLAPKILEFAKDFAQVNLAISLHAPNNYLRNQLMPINKKYDLKILMNSIKTYLSITNRRISFEYILLEGINDFNELAEELGKLLKGMLCYVNIIVYNNVNETKYRPSNKYLSFINILKKYGIIATKRLERGIKINAACGQLRANHITK
ncbi:MAG: 23S rRNA (adenine(2503)-C(2))-methyltransferase RlmN [Mycoplasmataceae bacterium]|jgi:23S rRNA (adenine2503-C2)-methyltransferase|nr:23S rRNA (adenine(2503)-C(2))-methyltransferase RlmN [Mycoplasmataceae bacterium]